MSSKEELFLDSSVQKVPLKIMRSAFDFCVVLLFKCHNGFQEGVS